MARVLKEDSLVFSLEGNTAHQPFLIAESKWNEVALAKCYPADVVQALGQMPLSCSGNLSGTGTPAEMHHAGWDSWCSCLAYPVCNLIGIRD